MVFEGLSEKMFSHLGDAIQIEEKSKSNEAEGPRCMSMVTSIPWPLSIGFLGKRYYFFLFPILLLVGLHI